MNATEARRLIACVEALVMGRDAFRAVAICGSWARGDPGPDSDLDVLIITKDPESLRCNKEWIRELEFADAGFRYVGHETVTYGVVWSAHISLEPHAALELTFAEPSWASVDPLDPGTREVVTDAFEILVDKDSVLQRLRNACS
jgi:uncharacterized protein